MTTRPIDTLLEAADSAAYHMQSIARTFEALGSHHKAQELRSTIYAIKSAALGVKIDLLAEDGKVAYIESGRDCDGVQYSGQVHITDATVEAYEALHDRIAEWADGPFHLELCSVSVAKGVQYESRDLVMEAHEEGHPGVIYSSFP